MTQRGSKIEKILFATAFRELSSATAPFACMMSLKHDAELHVLHVVPLPPPIRGGGDLFSAPDPGDPLLLERMEDAVKASLERLKDFTQTTIAPVGCRVIPAAVIGIIWDEIVNYAREKQIDLIIMGTRRHGVLRRLLMGSVTKAVIEHAPCPVMLVPVDDHRSDSTKDKAA